MRIGTKSVLFGAHCLLIHWIFVARGWHRLHGFKRVQIGSRLRYRRGMPYHVGVFAHLLHPALWVAFLVHDLGYFGKPNMDGPEGEQHPRLGAAIMRFLFGGPWPSFVLYHSRFLAKQNAQRPSALCMADKLAFPLTPRWLYLPMVRATGEIHEYMAKADSMNQTGSKYDGMHHPRATQEEWWNDVAAYVTKYVEEHRDGRVDTWTPAQKEAITPSGAWK